MAVQRYRERGVVDGEVLQFLLDAAIAGTKRLVQ
jgi:hypothetical protein